MPTFFEILSNHIKTPELSRQHAIVSNYQRTPIFNRQRTPNRYYTYSSIVDSRNEAIEPNIPKYSS